MNGVRFNQIITPFRKRRDDSNIYAVGRYGENKFKLYLNVKQIFIMEDKILNCLYGYAIGGDAIGLGTEFMNKDEENKTYPNTILGAKFGYLSIPSYLVEYLNNRPTGCRKRRCGVGEPNDTPGCISP